MAQALRCLGFMGSEQCAACPGGCCDLLQCGESVEQLGCARGGALSHDSGDAVGDRQILTHVGLLTPVRLGGHEAG